MQILLIGINHKTAGVDIREQVAFDMSSSAHALRALKAAWQDGEFVLLSTCNRVELYAAVDSSQWHDPYELARFLFRLRDVDYEQICSAVYVKVNEDAVRHLLMVTSSLDSMVIGESQIISQVKESYSLSCRHHCSGKILNHLFHVAFHTAKKIVSDTSIANRRVSVAGVAMELAKQLFTDIRSARVVVAGAGQMGQLLVEHFQQIKCSHITVINRSSQRSCQVAQERGVHSCPWENLEQEIVGANVVVGAASAPEGYLFNKEMIKKIMLQRHNKLLLMIDITVPRSFDPAINQLDGVYLYSIDDLKQVAEDNIKLRQGDLDQAVGIINSHVDEFMAWFATKDIGSLIEEMKKAFEQIRDAELDRFQSGLRCQADCQEQLDASVRNIVNKLFYCVVKNIRTISKEQGQAKAQRIVQGIVEHAKKLISDEKRGTG